VIVRVPAWLAADPAPTVDGPPALHDALPISIVRRGRRPAAGRGSVEGTRAPSPRARSGHHRARDPRSVGPGWARRGGRGAGRRGDRKSTRLNSSHVSNSYPVRCLKNKNKDGT